MVDAATIPLYGVILAGGIGSRFWPLSRAQYPKQVLRLLGSESMLQSTIERLLPRIPLERMLVVTNAAQADVISLELRRKGWQNLRLILEPEGRNTAPAVGLAAALLGEKHGAGLLAVFPADHFIRDQESLLAALDRGAVWAEAGYLMTFGIPPTRPETGFGYIKQGAPLDDQGRVYRAPRFTEKPPLDRARKFVTAGGYYWNSGIFMFRRDILLDAMARYLPELSQGLARLTEDASREALAEIYREFPNISLDHGILEKAENVAVVPVEMGWNDVGTWGALQDICPKDKRGNIILGDRAWDRDSKGCTFYAQDRLVATIGLENIIVVDTPDATLVCNRTRVQEVKDLVAELTRENMVESVIHLTVERPWGLYTVMYEGPGYKVKQIEVNPGSRLSLQMHQHRAEHWVVVQGTARVTIGTDIRTVTRNQSVYIPLKTAHRLENPAMEPLRIIEVQTGVYLDEDDIQRLDDDYSRS